MPVDYSQYKKLGLESKAIKDSQIKERFGNRFTVMFDLILGQIKTFGKIGFFEIVKRVQVMHSNHVLVILLD